MQEVLEKFYEIYGREGGAPRLFFAGGRFCIIGEHLDYNGGFILASAVDQGCYIFSRLNNSNHMKIAFTNIPKRAELDYSNLDQYKKEKYINYQAGTVSEMIENGIEPVGVDLLYHITVPLGRGLSSSAAIEVSTAYLLSVYHNEKNNVQSPIDLMNLALICQKAECEFVGMKCGIMDQFSSCFGKKNQAMLFNTKDLTYEYINLDLGDYVLEVIDTNKPHSLIDSKFNERRGECETGLRIIQETGSEEIRTMKYLCDISPEVFEAHGAKLLSGGVLKRAKHCVAEQDRVKKVAEALRTGDVIEMGKLMNKGYLSSRDNYEVGCKELDVIQSIAKSFGGCLGCRILGGGFGGSCIALVHRSRVAELNAVLDKKYYEATGLRCTMSVLSSGDGVREIKYDE